MTPEDAPTATGEDVTASDADPSSDSSGDSSDAPDSNEAEGEDLSSDPTDSEAAPEAEGGADSEAAEAEGGDSEAGDAEAALNPADGYRQALDHYLAGDLEGSLRLVDQVLGGNPGTELRPRLERLRRRAEDRLGRDSEEAKPEAPSSGEAEASETGEAESEGAEAEGAESPDPEGSEAEADASEAGESEAGESEAGESEASEPEASAESGSDEAGAAEETESSATEASTAEPEPAQTADEQASVASSEEEPSSDSSGRLEAQAESGSSETEAAPEKKAPRRGPDERPGGPRRRGDSGRVSVQGEGRPSSESGRRPQQRRGPKGPGAGPGPGRGRRPPQRGPRQGGAPAGRGDLERMGASVEALSTAMSGVEKHTMKVAEAYQRISRMHKRKEQAYDKLYEELRSYKDNFLAAAQRPVFKDVILVFDGVTRSHKAYAEREEDTIPKAEVLETLEHLREEILELLYRRDIEKIEERPEVLDIELQKPLRRVDTDDPAEDRKIEQYLREGFRINGAILRPQEVVVKRYKERES